RATAGGGNRAVFLFADDDGGASGFAEPAAQSVAGPGVGHLPVRAEPGGPHPGAAVAGPDQRPPVPGRGHDRPRGGDRGGGALSDSGAGVLPGSPAVCRGYAPGGAGGGGVTMADPLDFSGQRVFVVGGSSGI